MQVKKLTIPDISRRKQQGPPISSLTAYDYPWARIADQAGIDCILVGDSLGMVVLGYSGTVAVTMEEMLHHSKAVARGVERALIVTDMPFGSYNSSHREAITNATRLIKEGGADAVKLEGGLHMAETIAFLTARGVPVMAHVGLTPQAVNTLGGFGSFPTLTTVPYTNGENFLGLRVTSGGQDFFVSATGPMASLCPLIGYSVADQVLQPDEPLPRSVSSMNSDASAGGFLPLRVTSCQLALVGKGDS